MVYIVKIISLNHLCKVYTKSITKFVIYRFLSGKFLGTLDEWRENTDLANMIRKIKKC